MVDKRKHQIIEVLLTKPSKKPDFRNELPELLSASVLSKARSFLPEFITTTDRILSDPREKERHRMAIEIQDQSDVDPEEVLKEETMAPGKILMDIGVGVYDVLTAEGGVASIEEPAYNFHSMSTEQIVKVKSHTPTDHRSNPRRDKMSDDENSSLKSSSSSCGEQDDENLYLEFDSSDPETDGFGTHTTKDSKNAKISVIDSKDFDQEVVTKRRRAD